MHKQVLWEITKQSYKLIFFETNFLSLKIGCEIQFNLPINLYCLKQIFYLLK